MDNTFDLYRDIAQRTDGDVYIGVVGPVRTGKSTLIARMMEKLVLPAMAPGPRRDRLSDELPQSGSGRTIMTTQPKFVPGEAVTVTLGEQATVRVRMVDSVGYLVDGALGTEEDGAARMVHTPWFDYDIPFEQAAETGTRKVIAEHATIGLVVTTDGSISDIPRENYAAPEERVVEELKDLGKPFIVVLNSRQPAAPEAQALRERLQERYGVPVLALNVKEMEGPDIQGMFEEVLFQFPLREIFIGAPAKALPTRWGMLEQNADHAAAALVDDLGEGLLDLLLRVGGHAHELVAEPLAHQLVQALAEEVGVPDALGVVFKLLQQVAHQLLALLFGAHHGADLGFDVHADEVQ